MSYWLTTSVFGLLELLVLAAVAMTGKRGTNQLRYTLSSTTVFCMWLFWSIAYLAQMNPLVLPERKG